MTEQDIPWRFWDLAAARKLCIGVAAYDSVNSDYPGGISFKKADSLEYRFDDGLVSREEALAELNRNQVTQVTDEMVEAAYAAYWPNEGCFRTEQDRIEAEVALKKRMRPAIKAALEAMPQCNQVTDEMR